MRMQAPENSCSPCIIEGGKEYQPDDSGIVTVDNPAHAAVLRLHGYKDVQGNLGTAPKSTKPPKPAETGEDDEDEFDDMTKAEMIDWLEERDREDDIPAGKVKVPELRDICRKVKAELDAAE